jgi:hypothetical protein
MASILIKLLIDMWLAGNVHESFALVLSMLQAAILQPDTSYRTRVYDLLYNLSMHAHMIEVEEMVGSASDTGHAESSRKGLCGEALLRAMGYYRPQPDGGRFVVPREQQVCISSSSATPVSLGGSLAALSGFMNVKPLVQEVCGSLVTLVDVELLAVGAAGRLWLQGQLP